jgi:RHS repeat-associated protein
VGRPGPAHPAARDGAVPAGSLPAQTTAYAYDDAGRLTRITQQGQVTTYVWDADHRLTDKTLPNGIAVTYRYDAAGQVTEIAYRRTDGTLIERIAYQYDAAGRRLQKDALVAPSVDETPFTATYDAGNRLTRITLAPGTPAAATYDLAYDDTGNLIGKTNAADASDRTVYTWDSRNRLTAIGAPGLSAAFAYDSLGRRTQRTVTLAGQPAITTLYVYDGLQALGEIRPQQGAIAEQSTALITGLHLDEAIARMTSGANGTDPQMRTYLTDALGSVIAQTRADQSTLNVYGYSPYGQVFEGGADEGNALEYTARENDGTGLYFYRARYYDPVLKRFISEDPIGLAGGWNIYGYANASPASLSDPLGLSPRGGHGVSVECCGSACCKEYGFSDFVQNVITNFADTNNAIPGVTLPALPVPGTEYAVPGATLGALTAGAMAAELGSITPLQWAFSGFRALAGFTRLETTVIVSGTAATNFAFATVAYESGVLIGSIVNSIPVGGCGRTVRDAIADYLDRWLR